MDGLVLVFAEPRDIRVTDVSACELVQLVAVSNLGLRSSCSVQGGSLSFFSNFRSPEPVYRLLVATLRQSGADVKVSEGVLVVSGDGDNDAAGFSGEAPGRFPVQQSEDLPDGFVAELSPIDAIAVADQVSRVGQTTSQVFRNSPDELKAIAGELGTRISIVESGSGARVIGSPTDVKLLSDLVGSSEISLVSIPVVLDESRETFLAERFSVEVSRSDSGFLLVGGSARNVADFVTAVRRLGLTAEQRSIQASFVFAETAFLQELKTQLSGSYQVNAGALVFSKEGPLNLFFDAVRRRSDVSIKEEPSIVALDGQHSSFLSGREVPVLLQTDLEGGRSVEFRQVGTRLDAVTSPAPGGLVNVNVTIEVSSVDGVGVLDNPTFATRSVETKLLLEPGSTVILSGFSSSLERKSRGNQLFLPFKRRSDAKQELFVALTVK